jgi:hypothetical protein
MDYLRRREESALVSLLPVLSEVQECAWALNGLEARRGWGAFGPAPTARRDPEGESRAQYAFDALARGGRVEVPLVSSDEFRQRYHDLLDLAEQLVEGKVESQYAERSRGDLVRYVCHVRYCVKRLLHGQPLPEGAQPPVLNRVGDNAIWAAAENDPEDTWYPDPPVR